MDFALFFFFAPFLPKKSDNQLTRIDFTVNFLFYEEKKNAQNSSQINKNPSKIEC